jgi:uncharacterized protein
VILVDSNVPMYLIGSPHPHKIDAQLLLHKLIANGHRLVTDAEVLQEILHRYVAIGRDAIQAAFDALLGIVEKSVPRIAQLLSMQDKSSWGIEGISARDAIRLAVMQWHGIEEILTFDSGFDGFPGITRLS